ncbi:hypothetical protein PLICRDRAFT_48769 [Plicaturopsis crispa FD-325 SS-3]|nr:hypothetical protein PLICRDRAFT_48769 [Plicaturopsis crispa FD-325 SS-3]
MASALLDRLPLPIPKAALVGGAFVCYLGLVRALRWRRYNQVHAKYAHRDLDTLTPEEAQSIIHLSGLWDMPGLSTYSLSFALFKTYAIPTISAILAATKELSSKELIPKRYADTEILIATWISCPINGYLDHSEKEKGEEADPRAMIALARVNFLHSRYKISNDDYLYTLALFALEPMNWADRYGWRSFSPLERHAAYVYWREIGNRMSIRDIPESLEDLRQWSTAYEAKYMVPAETNRDVASYTVEEMLYVVPEAFGIKALMRRLVICLLQPHVRIAMMYPEQPALLRFFAKALLFSSGQIQRYLMLPRTKAKSLVPIGKPTSPYMHPSRFQAKPWYKPQRSGFGYLMDRLAVMVGYYADMPAPQYKSEGYRLEEMGPANAEKLHHAEIMRNAADMQGCPVASMFSSGL